MSEWNPSATPNFTPDEFACQCGCGRADMDATFMKKLQMVRDEFGPMQISSGYRCAEHNAKVSSTGETGPHTTGKAADIRCSGHSAHRLLMLAAKNLFPGIGVSQRGLNASRFIHLDQLEPGDSNGARPWVWTY
tara:strand:- start:1160 stop:1561 length:402 start_codon:yes stop_codon:yes gene_type:complete